MTSGMGVHGTTPIGTQLLVCRARIARKRVRKGEHRKLGKQGHPVVFRKTRMATEHCVGKQGTTSHETDAGPGVSIGIIQSHLMHKYCTGSTVDN